LSSVIAARFVLGIDIVHSIVYVGQQQLRVWLLPIPMLRLVLLGVFHDLALRIGDALWTLEVWL